MDPEFFWDLALPSPHPLHVQAPEYLGYYLGCRSHSRNGIPIFAGIEIPVDWPLGTQISAGNVCTPSPKIPGFQNSDPLFPLPGETKSWKMIFLLFLEYNPPVSCQDFSTGGLIPKKNIPQKIARIGFSCCSLISPAIPISMAMDTQIFHHFPFSSLSIKKGLKAPLDPKPHPRLLSSPAIPAGFALLAELWDGIHGNEE